MGLHGPAWFPDLFGTAICLAGVIAQYFVLCRLGVPKRLSLFLSVFEFVLYSVLGGEVEAFRRKSPVQKRIEDLAGATLIVTNLGSILAWAMLGIFDRTPKFDGGRRQFLRSSPMLACAIPAVIGGAAIITRKDFHVREVDIAFPNLPHDLQGRRLLQISDIHMGTFFSRNDLRRVVDTCNTLPADLVFVTGDLITTEYDPLDDCLLELGRLRSPNGIWGCMGNHEMYSKCQRYTKRQAQKMGIDFLRYESRTLRFGDRQLNVIGVDYQRPGMKLPSVKEMMQQDAFNLLLSHTPAIFPEAADRGIDLTLSGHTHGGQLNLALGGMNLNLVDFVTPYTKGLYRKGQSAVYVNSGLGTIGIPMRIGAPPEITVIRLCNS